MSDPVVKLESGLVRGIVEKHEDGFDYYAFKGIPYAEPPVGELRFKDPVSIRTWAGVKDCKNYGPMCMQYDFFTKAMSYSENCLHLNVFTRSINETNVIIPVIVLIHGGLFMFGAGDDHLHGPDYLIRKDVVLVTFNYRLGVLGFLNLEDEVAPGNLGLRDQLMALQWVQRNIRVFGGDPDNVTVLGMSAGGVAAQCLTLSPLAKGLIHKLIVHSNSVYNWWSWISSPKSKAIKLCSLLGKQLTNPKDIVDFLRTIDTESLLKAQIQLSTLSDELPFGLGVDDKSPSPLVPVHPEKLKNQGIHLPCLTGYNCDEAMIANKGMTRKEFLDKIDADFRVLFRYRAKNVLDRHGLTAGQARRMYYKDEAVSERNIDKYVKIVTELYFVEGIHKFLQIQAEQSSATTYFYVFSYKTSNPISQAIADIEFDGVGHFEDLSYVFKMRVFEDMSIPHFQRSTRKYKMMEQMTEMWANFARYGRPTVDVSDLTPVHWLPVADGTVLRYLNIDDDITMQSTLNIELKFLSAKQIQI